MTEIGSLKAASGAVAFTDGDRSVTNAQVMRRALDLCAGFRRPDRASHRRSRSGRRRRHAGRASSPHGWAPGRYPNAAEAVMLERDAPRSADRRALPPASLTCIESLEISRARATQGLRSQPRSRSIT
jgi:dihydroorotase